MTKANPKLARAKFDKLTNELSAVAVVSDGKQVARILFRHTSVRIGYRTTCFLQIFGSEMVSAFANDSGDDGRAEAFYAACAKLPDMPTYEDDKDAFDALTRFKKLPQDRWYDKGLEAAGFKVFKVF